MDSDLKNLSSPIQELPEELLVEIFTRIPGTIKLDDENEDIPARNLCLVSRRWLSIGLAVPSLDLWSSMDIDLDCCYMGDTERNERWTRLVGSILQRSLSTPLSVTLKDQCFDAFTGFDSLPILEQLTSQCHRWETASLAM